ncbi:PDR/VanB family oxidoreductase [Streptomyces sp. BI20]|uniref:PDR/VanB family oxidoreductase n=1 Tax=Streptomyces sp. BI20 TaxID=3403460 RepID=UPI003C76D472
MSPVSPRPAGPRRAPRAAALLLAGTAAAWLAKRAVRRRIQDAPLWPLPALETPVSGYSPRRPLRALITSCDRPAEDVLVVTVESPELPAWEPGAHVDLVLPSGRVRQYSLCGDPADTGRWRIAIRRVDGGRGGSIEAHEQLVEGAELELRPPRNRFPLEPAARYEFVAGGIGITPLLPMLRAAQAAGTPWRLRYGGRSLATMPFRDELAAYGDRVTLCPQDETGLPDLTDLADLPPGTLVHACGPEPMLTAVAEALGPEGARDRLRLERFAPASPGAGAAAGTDRPFTVELRRTGRVVEVPAGTSTLAAIRAELPGVPYSCEQGFCGTCQHRVLAGAVDHRDDLLTDGERADSMLLCVSRARGEHLVIDL